MKAAIVVVLLAACAGDARPPTTDPLEALAACVREAGITGTVLDSEAAEAKLRAVCPELVAP